MCLLDLYYATGYELYNCPLAHTLGGGFLGGGSILMAGSQFEGGSRVTASKNSSTPCSKSEAVCAQYATS